MALVSDDQPLVRSITRRLFTSLERPSEKVRISANASHNRSAPFSASETGTSQLFSSAPEVGRPDLRSAEKRFVISMCNAIRHQAKPNPTKMKTTCTDLASRFLNFAGGAGFLTRGVVMFLFRNLKSDPLMASGITGD